MSVNEPLRLPSPFRVSVTEPVETTSVPGDGGGHGIIGMRERATMLGGHLQAGPTEKGEFLVTAALPLGEGSAQDEP